MKTLHDLNLLIYLIVEASRYWDYRGHQMDAPFQLKMILASINLQKMSGQGVWTHPPMVLLAFLLIFSFSYFLSKKVCLLSLYEGIFIMSEVLSPLMVGKLFDLSWWCWCGGRAIIVLQATVRNGGRDDLLPSLSFCSAGGGV